MAASTIEGMIPDALLAHLSALVLSPELPIAYPDIAFTPPSSAYLKAYYIPNGNQRICITPGSPNRYQGILQVSVVFPSGQGAVKPNDVAGKIADHFAEGTQLQTAAGPVRIDKRPSVERPMQDTDRIQIPVSIDWVAYL
ncbi:DUF4128 domain-containing protein [Phyllobacterium sp. YR531]|uniref:DUF4128 domain-containing protein n=1 Tax=Phyllobacterium sp. YR531 TaxID=1144343 RepID=UPI00026FBAC5|nr:DUF4128 domain-containing protein [Phyllobacterium sp. YR531]EJN04233.1 hypothetical protein PMI41_01872 [Phyllobacterium sp. YR531]